MLINHWDMVTIILHEFVATIEALEHIQTLGNLFQHGGTALWFYSRILKLCCLGIGSVITILLWIS
jgi:hypothetical protein